MRVIFCDLNKELKTVLPELRAHLSAEVDGRVGDICTLTVEALVSPANSFGWMDGGVDAAYMKRFPGIETKVQAAIRALPFGELLVGQAISVETRDATVKHLIVAPTMRRSGPISNVADVMVAARAAMAEAIRLNVKSVGFPGMGSGTGELPYETAVLGMLAGVLAAQGKPFAFPEHHVFWVPRSSEPQDR